MVGLMQHARLLYLLALVQLLGGPLVLGGIFCFARMGQEPGVTLTLRITRAWQQAQNMEALVQSPALQQEVAAAPDREPSRPSPAPERTKGGKAKIFAITDWSPPQFMLRLQPAVHYPRWHDPAPVTRGQSPALPPPRLS